MFLVRFVHQTHQTWYFNYVFLVFYFCGILRVSSSPRTVKKCMPEGVRSHKTKHACQFLILLDDQRGKSCLILEAKRGLRICNFRAADPKKNVLYEGGWFPLKKSTCELFSLEQIFACKFPKVNLPNFHLSGSMPTSSQIKDDNFLQLPKWREPSLCLSGSTCTSSQVWGVKFLQERIWICVYKFANIGWQIFTWTNPSLQVPRWRAPNGYLSGSVSASSQVYGFFYLSGSAPSSSKG